MLITGGASAHSGPSEQERSSNAIADNARRFGLGNYNGREVQHMGGPGAQSLVQGGVNSALQRQQAQESSDLSRQGAGQDLLAGHQQGAFQILNTLLSKGYISEAQRDAALSHYDKLQGGIDQARGLALGQAQNGLFTDAERSKFDASFNPAMDSALEIAQTGGIDDADWDVLMADFLDLKNRNKSVADRGGLTEDEYNRILTSGRQDMMRTGKNNAESLFNQMGNSAAPFAAQALMTKTAADTGAGMAKVRSDLDKYQSDTRMAATDDLREALGLEASTRNKRAETRLGGVNAAKGMNETLLDFLSTDAGGRDKGISQLLEILGLEGSLVGEKAELETATDPGGEHMGIVDELMSDLGNMVNVKKKGKGGSQVKTPFGKSSTGDGGGSGSIGGGGSSGFRTGSGFR